MSGSVCTRQSPPRLRPCRPHLPNAVELIPTLGAPFPRGGPVQDPVLTPRAMTLEPSSGSNVIPRRARPDPSGLRPHNAGGSIVQGYIHSEGFAPSLPVSHRSSRSRSSPACQVAGTVNFWRCLLTFAWPTFGDTTPCRMTGDTGLYPQTNPALTRALPNGRCGPTTRSTTSPSTSSTPTPTTSNA